MVVRACRLFPADDKPACFLILYHFADSHFENSIEFTVPMKRNNDTSQHPLRVAVEAINNLTAQELGECFESGQHVALMAHHEIELAPVNQKWGIFFRNLVPWRRNLVSGLTNSYRRYFKLALAHPREVGDYPDQWALQAIQPAIRITLEQLHDWYILACDGENQYVRKVSGSIPFVPGETLSIPIPLSAPPIPSVNSWRAPAWLFQISPTLGFIGTLKSTHVPAIDSNDKLGAAYSRLVLKLARRLLLWELGSSVEKAQNEEIAAAGAIPAQRSTGEQARERKKQKHWLKGFEGLPHKEIDLSMYMDRLTERQRMAYSLRKEYQLRLSEVADRMGVNRKTAYEYIESADSKIQQAYSNEKRKSRRDPNNSP